LVDSLLILYGCLFGGFLFIYLFLYSAPNLKSWSIVGQWYWITMVQWLRDCLTWPRIFTWEGPW